MPRISRTLTLIENLAFHKTWRGHNKEWNLKTPDEKHAYTNMLNQELVKQSSPLRAACIMSNHSHEIYQLKDLKAFSDYMRRHHTRYGLFFNRKHHRRGKVAQDRPFTSAIEAQDAHEMDVVFYVHANPLRAKMVKDAKNYFWSTHRLFAFGKREKWMKNVELPDWYLRLGRTLKARQKKYRKLFDAYLREKGLIRRTFSVYGIGDLAWVLDRKETIRDILKRAREPAEVLA